MTEIIELSRIGQDYFADKKIAVVIGFFDGLHLGHQQIITLCKNEADKINGCSLVFTFDKPPLNVIQGSLHKKLIISFEEKLERISSLGVDYIITQNFNSEFSKISPLKFCRDILVNKFNLLQIFVGKGFKFGYKGQGDEQFLQHFFKPMQIKVNIIPLHKIEGITVSSTNIRKYYSQGNIDKIKLLLGRQPCTSGIVQTGAKRGRQLGFPTANISLPDQFIAPGDGVYLGEAELNLNQKLPCVINIGSNPTFNNKHTQIEVFIMNFNKNIYGAKIKICFLKKLRSEICFENAKQLKLQIEKDIKAARQFFKLN